MVWPGLNFKFPRKNKFPEKKMEIKRKEKHAKREASQRCFLFWKSLTFRILSLSACLVAYCDDCPVHSRINYGNFRGHLQNGTVILCCRPDWKAASNNRMISEQRCESWVSPERNGLFKPAMVEAASDWVEPKVGHLT